MAGRFTNGAASAGSSDLVKTEPNAELINLLTDSDGAVGGYTANDGSGFTLAVNGGGVSGPRIEYGESLVFQLPSTTNPDLKEIFFHAN